MDGSIRLRADERKTLLNWVRRSTNPQLRLRAHIIVLLADGVAWSVIVTVLYTSSATVSRRRRRFERGGLNALFSASRDKRGHSTFQQDAPLVGPAEFEPTTSCTPSTDAKGPIAAIPLQFSHFRLCTFRTDCRQLQRSQIECCKLLQVREFRYDFATAVTILKGWLDRHQSRLPKTSTTPMAK